MNRTLHIRIEQPEESMARMQKAAGKVDAGHTIEPQEGLSFASLGMYLSALTPRRWELTLLLKAIGPCSIRTLAKQSGRDYKSVYQDVQKLVELWLIQKRDDGFIEAPYDRIISDVRLVSALETTKSNQAALLDRRSNEARKQRVRLERA